jgi:hypothetical protein
MVILHLRMGFGVAADHIYGKFCMGVVWLPLGYVSPHPGKILKDMGVGFDPLMCARVTIPFNIVSLGATTRSTTTSRCPHGSR